MLSRFATLFAAILLFSTAVAHGKVAPAFDAQPNVQDQVLRQLINQPQTDKSCEVGKVRDLVAPAEATVSAALSGNLDNLCPIPAPPANPFGNVASL